MKDERRKHLRAKKELVALYAQDFETPETSWDMTAIKDISDEGMSIIVNQLLPKGEELFFRIKIPFRPFSWQRIKGRVLSCERMKEDFYHHKVMSYKARIEFCELDEHIEEMIRKYVEWHHYSKGLEHGD